MKRPQFRNPLGMSAETSLDKPVEVIREEVEERQSELAEDNRRLERRLSQIFAKRYEIEAEAERDRSAMDPGQWQDTQDAHWRTRQELGQIVELRTQIREEERRLDELAQSVRERERIEAAERDREWWAEASQDLGDRLDERAHARSRAARAQGDRPAGAFALDQRGELSRASEERFRRASDSERER